MKWFFETVGDVVHLDARLEDGDMLGDAHTEVRQGEDFFGVSYDALRKAGGGVVEIVDDVGRLSASE
jgi:hypothetical protein